MNTTEIIHTREFFLKQNTIIENRLFRLGWLGLSVANPQTLQLLGARKTSTPATRIDFLENGR